MYSGACRQAVLTRLFKISRRWYKRMIQDAIRRSYGSTINGRHSRRISPGTSLQMVQSSLHSTRSLSAGRRWPRTLSVMVPIGRRERNRSVPLRNGVQLRIEQQTVLMARPAVLMDQRHRLVASRL